VPDELTAAAAELDDEYLKVLLLMALSRARSEEPRRAGFWHAVAVVLAEEQEKRRSMAELSPSGVAVSAEAEEAELAAVIEEMRTQIATLEAEARESVGDLDVAGD
jgi:hypothetical protein